MKKSIKILSLLFMLILGYQVIHNISTFLPPQLHPDTNAVNSNILAYQAPSAPLWTSSYGGDTDDQGFDVVECNNGDFALTGQTDSFSAGGDYDAFLFLADDNGDYDSGYYYGGSGNEAGYAIIRTSDGGFAILGVTDTWTFPSASYNMYLVKTSSTGTERWWNAYAVNERSGMGWDLVQISDSSYVLVGYTYITGSSYTQGWIIRVSADGDDIIFSKTHGGSGHDAFYSITRSSNGGYAMAGYSYTSAANGNDFYLMRTDGAGDEWWSRTYHNSGDDVCYSIIECSDGGFALAGFTGTTDRDFWLVRTDEDGNVLWDKTYGDVGDEDNGFSVAQCWDDGFIIAGETDGWHSSIDYYLIRTDENGNTLWEQAYGTNGDDQGRVVVVCEDGSYAIVGFTEDSGSWDAMLMRIPATITSTPSTITLGFFDLLPFIIVVVVVIVIVGFGILLWRRRRTPELEA